MVETTTTTSSLEREYVRGRAAAAGGQGPYTSCPKIRRAVEAGAKIPALEEKIATLQLEAEVQRGSLVQIASPSSQLTRTLESCERERRALDRARTELAEELARKEAALSAFTELDRSFEPRAGDWTT